MRWADMTLIEPRLAELLAEIHSIKDDKTKPHFCANETWYERYKPRLSRLVGWGAEKEELRSTECYDLAYRKLYSPLPPCRRCGCL